MADVKNQPPRLTSKGQATRARILGVAADLILKRGVVGTQIDDVRRAAEVSGSQMTHYFKDKRALVKDVIAWQAQATLDNHTQPELGHLDSFASLRLWAHLVTERQKQVGLEGGCQFGSLAGQLVESDAETRADLAAGFERWLELFRKGLLAMRDRGDLRREADPEALAYALLGALQGGMLLAQTLRRIEPLRDALDAAVTHVESFAADTADAADVV
ncbi:transcriptional regulator, TetR family [Streptosporangium subroseum]|uniref:Transcriptional regulator, TetR family n=1 Tax=Streptosporangium subroseum TaxID=106412 RepID=A0A239KQ71_9ACTN|nr:TetR/AcrR family transcriptional regulator [Streptosporangium subroseum]SNT19828.1 transcriptional regulator, TetR family [Streptosporangium subroseum]